MRFALVLLLAAACGGSTESPMAELRQASGEVEGSRSSPDDWKPDRPGARYNRGHAVRTGAVSSAQVSLLAGGGNLRMGSHSLIRFGRADGLHRIALETGDAEIETGDAELLVDTNAGPARVAANASIKLTRDDQGTRLAVLVGTAEIEQTGAAALVLSSGDEVRLTRSGAVLVPKPEPRTDAAVAQPTATNVDAGPAKPEPREVADSDSTDRPEPADPGLRLGSKKIELEPPPKEVDLALPGGQSSILHAPAVPISIALPVGDRCDGDAVVEVRTGRRKRYFHGRDRVPITLRRGRNRYRLMCVGGDDRLQPTKMSGSLRLVRDSGRRKVVTKAPENTVEADGRTYRVLYQNRKPSVTFAWPRAPKASQYRLEISSRGKQRTYTSNRPSYTLASGKLAEGSYDFRLTAGNASSPLTKMVLDFDNAAPVAQLDHVAFTRNGVEVRGLATVGSKVAVNGVDLPLDEHHRFKARVSLPRGQRAIAVEIVRPGGDVHYYVRRAPD